MKKCFRAFSLLCAVYFVSCMQQPATKNLPRILSFSANPEIVTYNGGTIELIWKVENAISIKIDPDISDLTGNSKIIDVNPSKKTFTLSAFNFEGGVSAKVSVKLVPHIESFTANPSILPTSGGQVKFLWNVIGAKKVSINQGVGEIPSGSIVTIKPSDGKSTREFTLSAENEDGVSTNKLTLSFTEINTRLRIIPSVSFGKAKVSIDGMSYINGGDLSSYTNYISLQSGPHEVQVQPIGSVPGAVQKFDLAENKKYSLILSGSDISPFAFISTLVEDQDTLPISDKAIFRVFNGIKIYNDSIDLYLLKPGQDISSVTPAISNLQKFSVSEYVTIDSAQYSSQITQFGKKVTIPTCGFGLNTQGDVNLEMGKKYTYVLWYRGTGDTGSGPACSVFVEN
jgi:hypothetical protein